MYVRLPNLIQGQGQLTRKLVFQPASLGSNLHKQMRAAAEKLHVKTQKVRACTTRLARRPGGRRGGLRSSWPPSKLHACMPGALPPPPGKERARPAER